MYYSCFVWSYALTRGLDCSYRGSLEPYSRVLRTLYFEICFGQGHKRLRSETAASAEVSARGKGLLLGRLKPEQRFEA